MTFAEICSLVQKAASIASFLDPEPTSKGILADVAAAAQIAPAVVLDAQDAIARIKWLFGEGTGTTLPPITLNGIPIIFDPQSLSQKHIDAIETVHRQWTTYQKLGHNPVSPVPQ